MITYSAARLIVEREMNRSYGRAGLERSQRLRVFDEHTREVPWGWVIYFGDSYADIEEPDTAEEELRSRFPPCLVERRRGELMTAGKAWPLEKYVGDFAMHLLMRDGVPP